MLCGAFMFAGSTIVIHQETVFGFVSVVATFSILFLIAGLILTIISILKKE